MEMFYDIINQDDSMWCRFQWHENISLRHRNVFRSRSSLLRLRFLFYM